MNKAVQHPIEIIQVTKANFHQSLTSFKQHLTSEIFDYAIFNSDSSSLSSSNKDKELILTEISLCLKVNTSQDITHRIYTYVIPSIKFHRFTSEEKIKLTSECLKYFAYNKSVYNLSTIFNKEALSYENLDKEQMISESLGRILIDGKKSKKENMKSYCYYPKALKLHSLKFQRRLEEIIKDIATIIINLDYSIPPESDLFRYVPIDNMQESSYTLINEVMGFKWNLLFQPYITDMIRTYIDTVELKLKPESLPNIRKLLSHYSDFLNGLNEYLQSNGHKELITLNKVFDTVFYDNWRLFLLNAGIGKIDMTISELGSLIDFRLLKEDSVKIDNISNLVNGLLFLIGNASNHHAKIENLFLNNWCLLSLLPDELCKHCDIKYSLGLKLNVSKIAIDQEHSEGILNKITYENLYLNVDNKEEILYGYEFETELHKLIVEMKSKQSGFYSLKPDFAKDMELLLQNQSSANLFKTITSIFNLEDNKIASLGKGIVYKIRSEVDINIEQVKRKICEVAFKDKEHQLIQEELGVSLFYDALFASKQKIFGSNLYPKIAYLIEEIFNNKHDKVSIENQIKDFITQKDLTLYDLNYITKVNQFPFYEHYIGLAKEGIHNISIRFHYIISKLKNMIGDSKNHLSYNESYMNLSTCQCDLINKAKSKSIMITKENLDKKELISIAKKHGDFILNVKDNGSYQLDFLDSEEKFTQLKNSIKHLI